MSYPVFAGVACVALLAGCVGGSGFGSSRAAPVLDGAVQVGLPAGYCLDRAATQEAEEAAIAILGRCKAQSRVAPAIITVSIGPSGSATALNAGEEALVGFFTSDAGRATLSRQGKADDVTIIRAFSQDDMFYMRLHDNSAGEYWRAIAALGGRLMTLSVTGVQAGALDQDQGRKVLDQTLMAQRQANKG